MHEGIGDWCDCCSCEAEPRWEKVAEEFEIDLGDYEEAQGSAKRLAVSCGSERSRRSIPGR